MDVFTETLIKRKFTPSDRKKIIALFVTIIVTSVLFILVIPLISLANGIAYVSTISLLIFAAIIFFIWRMLKKMQLEFEYIITNGTMDIDKIVAQKKRSRLISLELSNVEKAGRFVSSSFEGRNFDTEIRAEKNPLGHENFYFLLSHPTCRRTLVVFTPDEKIFSAMHKCLPRSVSRTLPTTLS